MYNDDLLVKNESFDLDLQVCDNLLFVNLNSNLNFSFNQMLSDSPVALDQNLANFNDDQTLYQGS